MWSYMTWSIVQGLVIFSVVDACLIFVNVDLIAEDEGLSGRLFI